MAIAFGTISTVATVSSGNLTLNAPASAAEGDLLVACIAYRDSAAFTLPADWQLVAQESSGDTDSSNGICSGVVAFIRRGSSAPSMVFTRTGGDVATGYCVRLTGNFAAGAGALDVLTAITSGSIGNNVVATGFTTNVADTLILGMLGLGDATGSMTSILAATDPTSGWTEHADSTTTTGADVGIGIASAPKASAGATGDFTGIHTVQSRHVLIVAAFKEDGGAQGLTPSLYTDGDTFFAPTVGRGAVGLTPSLYTDGDTFHAPTATSRYPLTPALYSDADSFHAPAITVGAVNLAPALFSDGDTFHAPTVSGGETVLEPDLYADADTFHAPTVGRGAVGLQPGLYADADTFYAPTVGRGAVGLQPALYADADTFHSPTIEGGTLTLLPALFVDGDTFYAATVALEVEEAAQPGSEPVASGGAATKKKRREYDPDLRRHFGRIGGYVHPVGKPPVPVKARSSEITPQPTPESVEELTAEQRERLSRALDVKIEEPRTRLLERQLIARKAPPRVAVGSPAPDDEEELILRLILDDEDED